MERLFVHGKLMPQREIFEAQGYSRTAERDDESQ
jgi:hypothetical protein